MSNAICRYCGRVELAFDNAFKSKTGKLIPLDKTSGLPHQCADNPFAVATATATATTHRTGFSLETAC